MKVINKWHYKTLWGKVGTLRHATCNGRLFQFNFTELALTSLGSLGSFN